VIRDMPDSHPCCKDTKTSPMVSSQSALPQDIFKEVQRLACSGAFNSASIQRHIQQCYNRMVDTTLIYNIGYRARHKLFGDSGDLSQLYEQQKVILLSCIMSTVHRHSTLRLHRPVAKWATPTNSYLMAIMALGERLLSCVRSTSVYTCSTQQCHRYALVYTCSNSSNIATGTSFGCRLTRT
jgi:hypothetical protein